MSDDSEMRAFVERIRLAWPAETDFGDDIGIDASLIQPAMAYAISSELWALRDTWLDRAGADPWLVDDLPRIAWRYVDSASFRGRMRSSAEYLVHEVESGRAHEQTARCSADEVNLHLALRSLSSREGADFLDDRYAAELDVNELVGSWESHIAMAYDVLLRDVDIELLWDPSADGIENEHELLDHIGAAPMHPDRWFELFNDVDPAQLPALYRVP